MLFLLTIFLTLPALAEDNPHNESLYGNPDLLEGASSGSDEAFVPPQTPLEMRGGAESSPTGEDTQKDSSDTTPAARVLPPPPAEVPRIFAAARDTFAQRLGGVGASRAAAPIARDPASAPVQSPAATFAGTSPLPATPTPAGGETAGSEAATAGMAAPETGYGTPAARYAAVMADLRDSTTAVEAVKRAERAEREADAKRPGQRRLLKAVRRDK